MIFRKMDEGEKWWLANRSKNHRYYTLFFTLCHGKSSIAMSILLAGRQVLAPTPRQLATQRKVRNR